jgi:serine/threonine-protein kinase
VEGPKVEDVVAPGIRLVKRLRMGGMGSLWLAQHDKLATEVVVKFLSSGLCEETTTRTRFLNEAAAAAQVRSPHVVHMIDHGVTDGGAPFIVMEYLDGHDLGDHLRQGPLLPAAVAAIVEQVARALDAAHRRGVVHRDVKPGNIFLTDVGAREPFVKLLDFGIAKASTLQDLTTTGELIGTPLYMSPEQIEGRPIDPRSDLWSLGVVAFRALTGKRPFVADTVSSMAYQVVHTTPPTPTEVRPDLPPALDAWFAQACAKEPERRFSSARQMADELWRAIGRPDAASRPTASVPSAHGTEATVPAARPPHAVPDALGSSPSAASGSLGWPSAPTLPTNVPIAASPDELGEASTAVVPSSAPAGPPVRMEATGGSLQSSVSAVAETRRGHRVALFGAGAGAVVVAGAVALSFALSSNGDAEVGGPSDASERASAQAGRETATAGVEAGDGTDPAQSTPSASVGATASTSIAEAPAAGAGGSSEAPAARTARPQPVRAVPTRRPPAGEGDIEDLGF